PQGGLPGAGSGVREWARGWLERPRRFVVRRQWLAFVGLFVALSVGVTGCGSNKKSTTTTSTTSSSSVPVAKRGVVTTSMATVGDPGNKSVGVVQTFGGPKGHFVDPPKNTGIYKTCTDAPAAPPPCLTVGGVKYTYGIGEFETTVSQYVTFLNTADATGKNLHELYFNEMSPTVWPKYGPISYSAAPGLGEHYP